MIKMANSIAAFLVKGGLQDAFTITILQIEKVKNQYTVRWWQSYWALLLYIQFWPARDFQVFRKAHKCLKFMLFKDFFKILRNF